MKKLILGFILGSIITTSTGVLANSNVIAQYTNFNFLVNGESKKPQSQAIVVNGTSFLPVRDVAHMLGFDVEYHGDTRTIELSDSIENTNIQDSKISQHDNGKTLSFGETYDNGNIKITLCDLVKSEPDDSEKNIPNVTEVLEYKVKIELNSDTVLNGILYNQTLITDNEKYNSGSGSISNDVTGRIDFGETMHFSHRRFNKEQYNIKAIKINIPSLNIRNIVWKLDE